jgi:hypothetical protein
MFIETLEIVNTGVSIFDLSEKLFPTFKKFLSLLKNGELRVAILGAGGTGKTTLGKLFSGEFGFDSFLGGYEESIAINAYKLESNVFGSIVVAPGQKRREDTWDDLLREIADGEIDLIIHLTSWGYHSFGSFGYQEHRLYQNGMTIDEFVEIYTRDCLDRELEVLRRVEPHISIAKQKKTILITLVTKQDLWWNDRLKVKQHYIAGEHEKLIDQIRQKRGSSNFIHEYCSVYLVLENLISGKGELLKPTTSGYDQRLKWANYKKLIDTIEALLNISMNIEE